MFDRLMASGDVTPQKLGVSSPAKNIEENINNVRKMLEEYPHVINFWDRNSIEFASWYYYRSLSCTRYYYDNQ